MIAQGKTAAAGQRDKLLQELRRRLQTVGKITMDMQIGKMHGNLNFVFA